MIGTDTHPVLGGARVFKVTYTTNLSEETDSLYTNGTLLQLEGVDGHQTIWRTSPDGEEVTEITTDSTLYVEYRKITYAITYVVDGEVYATDSIEYGVYHHGAGVHLITTKSCISPPSLPPRPWGGS